MDLKVFASSSNSDKLSATWQGISLIGVAQGLTFILGLFGLDISEKEITTLLITILTGAGSLWAAYGMLRKIVNGFKKPA